MNFWYGQHRESTTTVLLPKQQHVGSLMTLLNCIKDDSKVPRNSHLKWKEKEHWGFQKENMFLKLPIKYGSWCGNFLIKTIQSTTIYSLINVFLIHPEIADIRYNFMARLHAAYSTQEVLLRAIWSINFMYTLCQLMVAPPACCWIQNVFTLRIHPLAESSGWPLFNLFLGRLYRYEVPKLLTHIVTPYTRCIYSI